MVALLAYAIDQVTKHLAVHHLTGSAPGGRASATCSSFTWSATRARPSAPATALTPVFSLVAIVASGGRGRGSPSGCATAAGRSALGLLLAGVVGNLTDRIFRAPGPVPRARRRLPRLPHWPVFNVADICIDVAGA